MFLTYPELYPHNVVNIQYSVVGQSLLDNTFLTELLIATEWVIIQGE